MRRRDGALPNLILIGAAKGGTTSLSHYLGAHPQIQIAVPNQLNFFVDDDDLDPDPHITSPEELRLLGPNHRNWSRGETWYRRHFDPEAPVRGETSVSYTAPWYPGAAERMARMVPDAKLVFVARDPIARAASHHSYLTVKGFEQRSIDAALASPRNPYISRSRYAAILEPYLRLFGRERIHVMLQEDLLADRRGEMRKLYEFAGVDPDFYSARLERLANRAADKGRRYRILEWIREGPAGGFLHAMRPEAWWRLERLASSAGSPPPPPSAETRARMVDSLVDDIARFEQISGRALPAWRRIEREA